MCFRSSPANCVALSERRTVATIFFCDPQLAHYIAANPPDDDMGDSGSDDEDASWESKWTEKQEKYKAYAVSKLQKHLAEIQQLNVGTFTTPATIREQPSIASDSTKSRKL